MKPPRALPVTGSRTATGSVQISPGMLVIATMFASGVDVRVELAPDVGSEEGGAPEAPAGTKDPVGLGEPVRELAPTVGPHAASARTHAASTPTPALMERETIVGQTGYEPARR